jgi:hypothetical protein
MCGRRPRSVLRRCPNEVQFGRKMAWPLAPVQLVHLQSGIARFQMEAGMSKKYQSLAIVRCIVVLAALFAMTNLAAYAQGVYGSIYGTVLDNMGAVVANATVTIKSQQKETTFAVQTNSVGQYRFDHLVPDTYTVTIKASGFKTFVVSNLAVNVGETPKVDANLEVGAVNESVTVAASAEELLKTERQDVTLSVPQETLQELPIAGQFVNNLLLLTPGAFSALGQSGVQALNPAGGGHFVVNGQPVGGVNFTLDGTDNTGPTLGYILINPAPNAVQEAKIITSSFDAETGRATSAVQAIQTKSGSNSFHGLLFDTRRSAANLARNPFVAAQSAPGKIAPALMNQPEFNIGGPIIKNRLFFFFDYFGQRQRQGGTVTTTVPTAHLRNTCLGTETTSTGTLGCDFGEYPTLSGSALAKIYQPDHVTQYPNNIIPAGQLSPQSLAILKGLPAPTIPNSVFNNFSKNTQGTANTHQYTSRVDYQITSKMHSFARWTLYKDELFGYPVFGALGGPTGVSEAGHGTGTTHSVSLGLDHAISDRLLMDVRIGYYNDHLTDDMANPDTPLAANLGIPGINNTGYLLTNGMPGWSIPASAGGAVGALSFGTTGSTPVRQREDQFMVANNWTRIMGTHTLKAGVDIRVGRENRTESFSPRTGTMTFGTGPTSQGGTGGLSLASFMLGDVTAFVRVVAKEAPKERMWRNFYYAQDTWRATQKLTFNFGVRWEIYFPETVDGKGRGALLNLSTGNLQVAGYSNFGLNMGQQADMKDFAPRVGLGYQLDNKTVIRAGFGRSFSQANYGSIFTQVPVENLPVYGFHNLAQPNNVDYLFTMTQGPPAFTGFTPIPTNGEIRLPDKITSVVRAYPKLRIPTVDSWNLSFQRALTSTLTATVAYVGNKGTHTYVGNWMYAFPNASQPILPGSVSVSGQTVYYDPLYTRSYIAANGQPFSAQYPDLDRSGHTANIFYLQPYFARYGWTQPIDYDCMCGDTHYNALQVTMEKRFSHGLMISGNYAFQLAKNYDSGYHLVDKKVTYGPTDTNFDHVATIYGFYRLPIGRHGDYFKNVSKWADALIGGYELSPNINLSSGQHFSVNYTNCNALNLPFSAPQNAANASAPCYPNQTGSIQTALTGFNPSLHARTYFTPTAQLTRANPTSGPWSLPALDTIGNFKRNSMTGPRLWNVDLAASKTLTIHENWTAQFRVNAFNVFNHINPSTPAGNPQFAGFATVDSPTAGRITAIANGTTPRQLEFAAKIQF